VVEGEIVEEGGRGWGDGIGDGGLLVVLML